jgi:ABC-type transporter Mla subunit MlaD
MDNGQPVTKAEFDASVGNLNVSVADLNASVSGLNASVSGLNASVADLNASVADLKGSVSGLEASVADLRSDLRSQKDELLDSMRQIETNLLTEFHRYAKGQNARVHNVEVGEYDMKLRLSVLEDRVLSLETRLPPSAL